MNKQQKTSLIITSIGCLVLAGFVTAGVTYALFDTESKVNIAVTSGKVNVSATVEDIEGVYPSGGSASFSVDGDNILKLTNWVPGSSVTCNLVITNNSNVSAKYRTVIAKASDNGLFSGLEIKVNNEEFVGTSVTTNYSSLGSEGNVIKVPVNINLPEELDDSYNNKSTELSISVEAILGNVFDGVYTVSSTEEAQEALDKAIDGDTIVLETGSYETLYLRQNLDISTRREDLDVSTTYAAYTRSIKNLTIKAASTAIVNCAGFKSEAGLFFYDSAPASNQKEMGKEKSGFISYLSMENVVIDGINFNSKTNNAIFLRDNASDSDKGSTCYVDNFIVKNCTGSGDTSNTSVHFFYAGSGATDEEFLSTGKKGLNNIYLVGNTMNSYCQAITFNNSVATLTNFTAKGNKFESCIDNNVQMSNKLNSGEIVFDNNTLENQNGRFLRLANASSDALIRVRNTKVETPVKYDDDNTIFKVTGTEGFNVISANNAFINGSFDESKTTWSTDGDKTLLNHN